MWLLSDSFRSLHNILFWVFIVLAIKRAPLGVERRALWCVSLAACNYLPSHWQTTLSDRLCCKAKNRYRIEVRVKLLTKDPEVDRLHVV